MTRKARVAVDIHQIGLRQTGNETYIRNLVEQLAILAPPELEFVCFTTQPESRLPMLNWPGPVKRLWPHTPLLRIPCSFPLALRQMAADIAHFQYVSPPYSPCPAVVMVHDISFELFPECFNPLSRKRMQLLIPRSARKAARVLTVSEFSKRQLVETYHLPEDHVVVTHNGVSPQFRPLESLAPAVARLAALGVVQPFILGVGNLQPRKNLVRLLQGYARLRKQCDPPHRLVLVGQKAWRGHQVEAEITRLGLGDWVDMPGYVDGDSLVALYNAAEIFVYPSLYEGFGLPVVEAMACGTPVITSNVSSLPEVAGEAALLVDPLSVEELGVAMERLLDDSALRVALREKGLRRAQDFSWRQLAEQTVAVYRQCLGL